MTDISHLALTRRALIVGATVLSTQFTVRAAADPDGAGSATTAALSHHGQVELTWPETTAPEAVTYTVHRSASGTPELSEQTLLARLGVFTPELRQGGEHRDPAFGDFSTRPHSSYTYVVAVRNAEGDVIEQSAPSSVTTADRFDGQHLPIVAYAYRTTHRETVISWRAAPGLQGPVTVNGGPSPTRNPSWRELTRSDEQSGTLVLHGGQGQRVKHVEVSVGDAVTRLEVMEPNGPRLLLTPDLADDLRDAVGRTGSTHTYTFEHLLADLEKPHLEWVFGRALGPERVAAVKASDAALAWQLTGDDALLETAYDHFLEASSQIYFGNADQPLYLGAISSRLALAYDWARTGWSAQQRGTARFVLTRIAAIWTATHYLNDYRDDKASNWVGITRAGEILVRLALLGGEEYVDDVDRTVLAIDELSQHMSDGYGASGASQEGLAYTIYPLREVIPAALGLRSMGIDAVEDEFGRHQWANLALHTQSSLAEGQRTQFGVDNGRSSSHQWAGEFVAQALAIAPPETTGAVRHLYDMTSGIDSVTQDFGAELGRELTLLYYPRETPPEDPMAVDAVAGPLLDPDQGAFFFRNAHEGGDDVLVGTFNRNSLHAGWHARESFGLPVIGFGSVWTVMGEKPGNPWRLSKPLVDGQPEPTVGRGRTLTAHALAGQGGGYVELDASANYEVDHAHRTMVVDMLPAGQVGTFIAIHDTFDDAVEHTWTWQLTGGPGVSQETGADEDGLRTFVYRRAGAWMKGWVLAEDGQGMRINTSGSSRVQIETSSASTEFRVLLALGRGEQPTASLSGSTVTVAGVAFDFDALSDTRR